ncbi:DUF3857 domain-containing protein [Polaribacter sp. P097]|uniref:DUF3857 domain-containing protein n=1 Tax=Polaribacter sp. P097 TaxID=3117398 RepID=UPI002FE2EBFC
MKRKLLLTLFIVIAQFSIGQNEPFYKSYDWEKSPNYKVDESEENMVSLKEKLVTEFFYDGDNFVEYFLEHKVLWLNSDDVIEDYNKIYLPFSSDSELQINKARVIDVKGKIIELDESKILTAEDEESGRTYKYFAFEGITKGSFIEFLYVVKRSPLYMGKRITVQASYPKSNVQFDLFSPNNLIFDIKTYNGVPSITEDTTNVNKNHYKLRIPKIDKLENEYMSAYNASRGSLIYKLDKNTANNSSNIVSYDKVSQNLYDYYYKDYSKNTVQAINSFLKELNISSTTEKEQKIRVIDNFIKSNVYSSDIYSEDLENLDEVLNKKVANETGVLKLYLALLRSLNIKHELVLTSNRKELKFDRKFEANNFLTEFLIYFPKYKKYLSPNANNTRYGFPAPFYTDNYGLFIKEVTVGDFKSALGKIKYIKPVKAAMNFDTMVVDVSFDEEDLTTNNIHFERAFNGYYAMNIQPFTNLIIGEKRQELIDGIFENISENIEISKSEMINDSPNLFGVKPITFISDFSSNDFVEKAGRKYLFKLGKLIGAQMQLYQEKKRVLPLENEFQRSYFRTINIKIPEGYKITNLDEINISNVYNLKGKELFSFKSYYSIEGNVLKITADEHYRTNIVAVDIYEEYRKVINSAADFNKIVLLLEKE